VTTLLGRNFGVASIEAKKKHLDRVQMMRDSTLACLRRYEPLRNYQAVDQSLMSQEHVVASQNNADKSLGGLNTVSCGILISLAGLYSQESDPRLPLKPFVLSCGYIVVTLTSLSCKSFNRKCQWNPTPLK